MTLQEWDRHIAPRLGDIEYYSNSIIRQAHTIQLYAQLLPAKPYFETRAHSSLAKAEQELRLALSVVKAAKEQYEQLPELQAAE